MNTPVKNSAPRRAAFPWAAALIAGILLFAFHAVLNREQVLFANDAPLGRLEAQASIVWSNFEAYWVPLDWIGLNLPAGAPSVTPLSYALLGPVAFAKFHVPLSLLLLGLSARFFCRRAGLGTPASLLAGVAAALNSNMLSYACWGLPGKAVALAFVLLATGLLSGGRTGWRAWAQVAVAGCCVGLTVIEGADVGAILSMYVAAFAVWQTIVWHGSSGGPNSWLQGGLRLALVVVFAGWLASHAISSLIGTQIAGVSGMSQKAETRTQRWEFATWGSYPKLETLRFVVPGIFGYRMDAPDGGAYWGSFGSGTPNGRYSGSGEYVGVLVLLVASYGVSTSLRRGRSCFAPDERKQVWFWTAVAAGSLLLAFGKFAPFYELFFSLPYLSTIRVPAKFLHGMNLALWVLFAYGLEALARGHLETTRARPGSWKQRWAAWRAGASAGERRWLWGCLTVFGLAVFAATIYAASAEALTAYLGKIEFTMSAPATAAHSIREVWVALGFLAASLAVVLGVVVGWFDGQARLAWWLLGTILVVDLYRASTPWVKHYDYLARYQSNEVIDLLKEKPWEQRVTAFLDPRRVGPLVGGEGAAFWVFLQKEWLEHHFQFFRIQSLDIDQMPRMPELEEAYFSALSLMANQNNPSVAARLWQLTNTRYLLGSRDVVDQLNQMVDPIQKRLRLKMPFALALKPGAKPPAPTSPPEEVVQLLTATRSDSGPFAVIEFTGALPRAKLYSDWQSGITDRIALETLRSPTFDPARQLLLSQNLNGIKPDTNAIPGDAAIVSYAPKRVVVSTKSAAAAVLLLNDRWHPAWKVSVDGTPSDLLRANFIMRGVFVPAGEHIVEFRFDPPHGTLLISLSAIGVGLVLVGLLVCIPEHAPTK